MKFFLLIITAILVFLPQASSAQTGPGRAEDEKAIRRVIENLAEAWSAGDGRKFADQFTDDVDYTVWNGFYFSGREANLRGHQEIFDTVYKGTRLIHEVQKIRFPAENVAIVHLASKLERDGKQLEDVPPVRPLLVLEKKNGSWRISVLQNTPVIKRGELVPGRGSNQEE
ncbi:MAG: SgcJ/EcaC family oxidoreductase [Pyrinomonadaceae bacterium]